METRVQSVLLVSFFMVRQVVAQGQCIRENIMVHRAVTQVQPLATSSSRSWERLEKSVRVPADM